MDEAPLPYLGAGPIMQGTLIWSKVLLGNETRAGTLFGTVVGSLPERACRFRLGPAKSTTCLDWISVWCRSSSGKSRPVSAAEKELMPAER